MTILPVAAEEADLLEGGTLLTLPTSPVLLGADALLLEGAAEAEEEAVAVAEVVAGMIAPQRTGLPQDALNGIAAPRRIPRMKTHGETKGFIRGTSLASSAGGSCGWTSRGKFLAAANTIAISIQPSTRKSR